MRRDAEYLFIYGYFAIVDISQPFSSPPAFLFSYADIFRYIRHISEASFYFAIIITPLSFSLLIIYYTDLLLLADAELSIFRQLSAAVISLVISAAAFISQLISYFHAEFLHYWSDSRYDYGHFDRPFFIELSRAASRHFHAGFLSRRADIAAIISILYADCWLARCHFQIQASLSTGHALLLANFFASFSPVCH